MKKTALASLMFLMTVKLAGAFYFQQNSGDKNFDIVAENAFFSMIYLITLIFFILAKLFVFFLRKQKDYLILTIIVLSAFVSVILNNVSEGLGKTYKFHFLFALECELVFFIMLFTLQIFLLIRKSGLRLPGEEFTQIKINRSYSE